MPNGRALVQTPIQYFPVEDNSKPHWVNDRLRELEEIVPILKERGEQWIFIGSPRMRDAGVVEYSYISVPGEAKDSSGTPSVIGWFTLEELVDGKHLEVIITVKKNIPRDGKHTAKGRERLPGGDDKTMKAREKSRRWYQENKARKNAYVSEWYKKQSTRLKAERLAQQHTEEKNDNE